MKTELCIEPNDWSKIPIECRLFGISIEYEPDAINDILSLQYFSASDVVLYTYREPYASAPMMIEDRGLPRLRCYLKSFRGKIKSKKFWMRINPRYMRPRLSKP